MGVNKVTINTSVGDAQVISELIGNKKASGSFTIVPPLTVEYSAGFVYYIDGKRIVTSSSGSVSYTTDGVHYIYGDEDGFISISPPAVPSLILATVIVDGLNITAVTDENIAAGATESIKNNLTASAPPTSTDDIDLNYSVGSRWIVPSSNDEYVCTDNTVGAAVWKSTTALATAAPVGIGVANSEGVSSNYSRSDHVHDHGAQSDPVLHAEVTTLANGFMSFADKIKIDGIQDSAELNTASNVGVAGVGVFKQKTGSDLEFKSINTASAKVVITDDTVNNEIDIDIAEGNIVINNLSGILDIAKGGTGQSVAIDSFDALSPTSVKGDIIVHDGTNSSAVSIGADDEVLIADSTQASGVRWGVVPLTQVLINVSGQLATNSTTYVVPTGGPSFTAPYAGVYFVIFKSSASSSASSGGSSLYIGDTSLFVNATQVLDSEVVYQRSTNPSIVPISTHTILSLAANDVVDIRMRVGAGSSLHTFQLDNSNLTYIKIG